ncbi:MAG: PHP domain-containing protein, partial [bacterium]
MSTFDLHLHTTCSDGTLTPAETVAVAAERGVRVIAITDHDTVAGIAPARAVAAGVQVISGVEINTEVKRENIHILGYGFDPENQQLLDGLAGLREGRRTRARQMLKRLADIGYPLDDAAVMAYDGAIGRPHLARALVAAGYLPSESEVFARVLGNRCPAYVPREKFTPEEAIALIHAAGGIASLAHPGKLGDPMRFIRQLCAAGLDGLEAYHSDHSPQLTARMVARASEFGLLVTGGTDSHGPGGSCPRNIGGISIPDEICER